MFLSAPIPLEQRGNLYFKRRRNVIKNYDAQVPVAVLNLRQVGPVHPGTMSKLLLGQPAAGPQPPDVGADHAAEVHASNCGLQPTFVCWL